MFAFSLFLLSVLPETHKGGREKGDHLCAQRNCADVRERRKFRQLREVHASGFERLVHDQLRCTSGEGVEQKIWPPKLSDDYGARRDRLPIRARHSHLRKYANPTAVFMDEGVFSNLRDVPIENDRFVYYFIPRFSDYRTITTLKTYYVRVVSTDFNVLLFQRLFRVNQNYFERYL